MVRSLILLQKVINAKISYSIVLVVYLLLAVNVMEAFRRLFKCSSFNIIGMIHLRALPGSLPVEECTRSKRKTPHFV